MCGIFGVVSASKISNDFLELSVKTNQYRGPDSTNHYQDFSRGVHINFGHTRLTITGDHEHGRQPLIREKMTLVYNGEIFSFENIHVNGVSDTELLAAFLEDGITNLKLNSLNGFFAFSIYYPESGSVYLVRDRFGEKPLYYKIFDDALYFSSTASPFKTLGVGVVSPIKEIPGGGISYDENLPIEGVLQVPPGHMVEFNNGIAHVRKWYEPKLQMMYTTNNYLKAVDDFNHLLFDAVRIRIKDQDTVAASLSGGLDSTLVVDTIKKIGNVNIEAFTLSTSDARFNELEIVKHHASKIGVNLNVVTEPSHDLAQFNRCLDVLEFPSFNFSFVGYDSYYKAVSEKGIRVIIEGHGPDEYLGGYAPMLIGYMAGRVIRGDISSLYKAVGNFKKNFGSGSIRTLLSVVIATIRSINEGQLPSGQRVNYKFFESLSIPIVLRTFDRISMLNNVETRSPFMDYRLVELGRSLPDNIIFNQGKTKSMLRTILESRGFKDSDFGPKIGFTATYDSVLRDLCIQHGIKNVGQSGVRRLAHKSSFDIAHAMSQKNFS